MTAPSFAVIPGAQVLFGLLLTVAFSQRFHELGDADRYVYFGTFVSAIALTLFEVFVAALQAYIFVVLTAVYLNLSVEAEH